MPSTLSRAGKSAGTAPFGKRIKEGAESIFTASCSASRNRAPSRGAFTCILGTIPLSAKSHIP